MDEGIGLQLNNQTRLVIENLEQSSPDLIPQTEDPAQTSGNENGAVLSKLDWQNRRAEDRRQKLTAAFGDGIQNGGGANTVTADKPKNLTNPTWNDLIDLAREREDFAEFRRQPKKFWRQVRQMSETRIVKDDGGNETRTTSRFDQLLADMQAKKLSPREFAETLPPNEREVFKARFQIEKIEKTFGADIFEDDGVTLNETGQTRLREISIDTNEMSRVEDSGEGEAASRFSLSGNAPAITRGETMFGAKSAALPGENVAAAPQNFNGVPSDHATLQNTAPVAGSQIPSAAISQTAVGANAIMPESFAARGLTNAASENTPNIGAAAQRDSGTIIGGALINGAFAAVDNYKNLENKEIGGSRAGANVFGEGSGFAAGATGAMFGAAVGTVIPGAGTVVGGILGFVSSLVVGVEIDQGLRWLGAGRTTFDATAESANTNNRKQLTTDNSFAPDLNLQPALA